MIADYSNESMYTPQKQIFFDTAADIPELEAYAAEKSLKMGSCAVCCEDGSEYLLNSSGKWNKKL